MEKMQSNENGAVTIEHQYAKKKKKKKKKVSLAIDLMDPQHNAKCKTIKVLTKHIR